MSCLYVAAGPQAFAHIQKHGLNPQDIDTVVGASGAAKWLTICGLDKAVFGQWLGTASQTVELIGTSIGAYKLAAAAQGNPSHSLDMLAEAYVAQSYPQGLTPEAIELENEKILNRLLGADAIDEVLSHPRYRFHCAAVRCQGSLARPDLSSQKRAMALALAKSSLGRSPFQGTLERILFSDPRSQQKVAASDGHLSHQVRLHPNNFKQALKASGAIPVYMKSVNDIEGAGAGVYRDGGLLDYHPVPSRFWKPTSGLTLYPHFYRQVKPGWFDKFYARRKAGAQDLSRAIVIAPSASYVQSLPGGRIPSKEDFKRFQGQDARRMQNWQMAIDRSEQLGNTFLEWAQSGKIVDQLQLIYP